MEILEGIVIIERVLVRTIFPRARGRRIDKLFYFSYLIVCQVQFFKDFTSTRFFLNGGQSKFK